MSWSARAVDRAAAGAAWWRRWSYGTRQDWSEAWRDLLRRDPEARSVRMVVDLVFGDGRRRRLATVPMELSASRPDGVADEVIQAEAGMTEEPEVEVSYSLGTGTSSGRSLTVALGDIGFNPWESIRRYGRPLAGQCEISLVAAGLDWSERLVILRGEVAGGVSFGVQREGLSASVSDPRNSADLGITEYIVDLDGLSDAPDASIGLRYPLAMNSPVGCALVRATATAPPTWLVCYGHTHDADAVYVDGVSYASGSAEYPWSVEYLFDALGVPYTAVVFTAGSGAWEDGTTVYADLSPANGQPTTDLVQTIARLLSEWSVFGPAWTSRAVLSRASAALGNRGAPGIYINGSGSQDAVGAITYVEQTICGSFPMVSMAWQIGGYGPVVTDRRRPAVARWIVGQGVVQRRATPWEESPSTEIYNWFTLRYGYDAQTDTFSGVVERNPSNSLLCRMSQESSGPQVRDPIESTLIVDDAQAAWVIDWLTAHLSVRSYVAEYPCTAEVFLRHRLGENIDLVDAEIYGCDEDNPVRATIEGIVYRRGSCRVRLRAWPGPALSEIGPDSPAAVYAGTTPVGP